MNGIVRNQTNPAPATDVSREALPVSLGTKQAAELLNVPERTMASLCQRGDVKAFKLGNRWRINRDALLAQLGY